MNSAKSQDFNRSKASLPDCIDSQVGGHNDGLKLQSSSGEEIFRGFVSLFFCLFKQLRPGHDSDNITARCESECELDPLLLEVVCVMASETLRVLAYIL